MNTSDLSTTFEQAFKEIGIPPRPAILDHIRAEMAQDEPRFKALGQLIAQDVGLAAGLIKTANSPYYGYRTKARNVDDAIKMLGLNAVSRAIAALSLRGAFPKTHELERFWDASARIANLSAWLVDRLNVKGLIAADAQTFGLFRDCGIPVLLLRFPHYQDTLRAANSEATLPFTATEQKLLPTDHAMVGSLLAQNWWLPEDMYRATRHHHDLAALESSALDLSVSSCLMIAVSQTAEYLIQQTTGLSDTREWGKLGPACLERLQLSTEALDHLRTEVAALPPLAD